MAGDLADAQVRDERTSARLPLLPHRLRWAWCAALTCRGDGRGDDHRRDRHGLQPAAGARHAALSCRGGGGLGRLPSLRGARGERVRGLRRGARPARGTHAPPRDGRAERRADPAVRGAVHRLRQAPRAPHGGQHDAGSVRFRHTLLSHVTRSLSRDRAASAPAVGQSAAQPPGGLGAAPQRYGAGGGPRGGRGRGRAGAVTRVLPAARRLHAAPARSRLPRCHARRAPHPATPRACSLCR